MVRRLEGVGQSLWIIRYEKYTIIVRSGPTLNILEVLGPSLKIISH